MRLKQKLPVTYLLFTFNGRLSKGAFWLASLFYWCTFYVLYNLLLFAIGEGATFTLYPLLFWIIIATCIKRLHDQDYSGYWLFTVLIPVLGPLWLFWRLGFKKGNYTTNQYGSVPGSAPDYLKNDEGKEIPHLKTDERIIDDVTRLNPVLVSKIVRPTYVEEICEIVKNTTGAISVGGGRLTDKSLNITANYKVLFTQPIFTKPGLNRVAIVTTVKDLSKILKTFQTDNVTIEHVYDY